MRIPDGMSGMRFSFVSLQIYIVVLIWDSLLSPNLNNMEIGMSYTASMVVGNNDTALAAGSGSLLVLATPRMIALMEEAAMKCVADSLSASDTTVGTLMNVSHVKASPMGADIRAVAELTAVDGRKLSFSVKAYQDETLIGEGTHERFVVNIERFMSKLG